MNFSDKLGQHMAKEMETGNVMRNALLCDHTSQAPDDELDDLLIGLDDDVPSVDDKTLATTCSQSSKSSVTATALITSAAKTGLIDINAAKYRFPLGIVAPALATGMSNETRLRQLVSGWKVDRDYLAIREEYCRLSIAINHDGLLAPAFRPSPKISRIKVKRNDLSMVLHKDQLAIDCHWLWCRRETIMPRDVEYDPLFDLDTPFPFDLASEFASKVWTKVHRADEALILTRWQQSQMRALRGAVMQSLQTAITDGSGTGINRIRPTILPVKLTLREWSQRDKRILPQIDAYQALWTARELLGMSATRSAIASLAAMMQGTKKLDESTITDKLKKLDKRMAGAI